MSTTTLISADATKKEKALDFSRLLFSNCLLLLSTIAILWAIFAEHTLMPENFVPPIIVLIFLIISLFILGVMEGLQISVVELANHNPDSFRKTHPRAAKLVDLGNRNKNVQRFLIGRQVLVVLTVFVAARITTFDDFFVSVPDEVVGAFMNSGFLGVILVVIVAQLTPQVLASAFPVVFLNFRVMKYAYYACLIVEGSGIAHGVWSLMWLLTVPLSKWSPCGIGKQVNTTNSAGGHHHHHHDKPGFQMIPARSVTSINTGTDKGTELTSSYGDLGGNRETSPLDKGVVDIARRAEQNTLIVPDSDDDDDDDGYDYTQQFAELAQQCMPEIHNMNDTNKNLFYSFPSTIGDIKYPSPGEYYQRFQDSNLQPPRFLLPPDHSLHIPPHVVAMQLLKMVLQNSNNSNKK